MARFETVKGKDVTPFTKIYAHGVDGKERLLEAHGMLGASNPRVRGFVQTIRPGCEATLVTVHAGVRTSRVRIAEKSEDVVDVYEKAGIEPPPVRRSVPLAIAQTFGFGSR